MRALGIAITIALVLRTESVNADLVVRGETATIDRPKLDGLVQLELGNATDVEVIVDVSAKSAAVTLERRGGERRTGIVDLPASGGAGEGIRARTTSGFGVAGAGFLEARWAVARPIVVTLALEGGALGPGLELRADNRRAMTASGPFVGTSLGMGFAP